jgi:hypothetical protein
MLTLGFSEHQMSHQTADHIICSQGTEKIKVRTYGKYQSCSPSSPDTGLPSFALRCIEFLTPKQDCSGQTVPGIALLFIVIPIPILHTPNTIP